MHLSEACLCWLPLSAKRAYRDTIEAVLSLDDRHFWSDSHGCLFEYLEDDWACTAHQPGACSSLAVISNGCGCWTNAGSQALPFPVD